MHGKGSIISTNRPGEDAQLPVFLCAQLPDWRAGGHMTGDHRPTGETHTYLLILPEDSSVRFLIAQRKGAPNSQETTAMFGSACLDRAEKQATSKSTNQ